MQKRHFEAIAAAVADNLRPMRAAMGGPNNRAQQALQMGAEAMAAGIATSLADKLAEFNPGFDRERFIAATTTNPRLAALTS